MINEDAIYYMNKLVGLGIEARRLQSECEQKTGIRICGLGAQFDDEDKSFYLQTRQSIDKLGLPVKQDEFCKLAQINGYRIVEMDS